MQRLILALFILLSVALLSVAETYQITALTTPSITIGGKSLKVGDRFNGTNNIKWIDNNQSMEVKALSTGALYVFSSKVFKTKGAILSIADYFLKTNKGSSRGENATPMFSVSPVKDNFPEKRIALVIGNSNYENLSFLRNAQKDAADIGETLKQLGFDVMEIYESDYSGMKTALNNFASKARNYDVALFYYAGHGIQEKGQNYLVPIERELSLPSEVNTCLNCEDVMQLMEEAHVPAKLMFIDACRNTKKSWSRAAERGLARMEGPVGSVILFSTQSGNVAQDGTGDNSPFAQSMIKNIRIPNISFNEAIDGVVRDTYAMTNAEQCPLKIGTLLTPFSFNSPIQRSTPTQVTSTANGESIGDRLQKAKEYYSKKDYTKALKIYRELADLGNAEAQDNLGWMYLQGEGVTEDLNEAAKWYRKAANQGDVIAQCCLGYMYENGYGVVKNYEEAAKWYRKAADQGHAIAQCNLGIMYDNGHGVVKNYEEAVKWFRKAADQGDATAQSNLGYMYRNGYGVAKNYEEAVKWFRKAADQGDTKAQYSLGFMYENGYGVVKNYEEAVKWYRKAADQGHAAAQNNLGRMYENGYGVEKNYEEAVKWYSKAANQGDAIAQGNLGHMYRNGYGVEKNYEEAVKWFRKAADQGDAMAQCTLGYMYGNGYGVEKNYEEAVKWFRKAADQGDAMAQGNLGYMYENGYGVEKNYAEAVKWYRKAADNGDEDARKWIAEHSTPTNSVLTVTGKIVDGSGEGLVGVTVVVDGTKTATSTDINGNFSLKNIADGSILRVSYIGYKSQTVKITSKNASGLVIRLTEN